MSFSSGRSNWNSGNQNESEEDKIKRLKKELEDLERINRELEQRNAAIIENNKDMDGKNQTLMNYLSKN